MYFSAEDRHAYWLGGYNFEIVGTWFWFGSDEPVGQFIWHTGANNEIIKHKALGQAPV